MRACSGAHQLVNIAVVTCPASLPLLMCTLQLSQAACKRAAGQCAQMCLLAAVLNWKIHGYSSLGSRQADRQTGSQTGSQTDRLRE